MLSVILLAASAEAVVLPCDFFNFSGPQVHGYNCRVAYQLSVSQRNESIENVTGYSQLDNGHNFVDRLFFYSNPKMKFIPVGYSKFFKKLHNIWVAECPLQSIRRSDFAEGKNLTILGIRSSNIEEIPADVFWDMGNLVELFLHSNQIKTIHQDSLIKAENLKIIKLSHNMLESLPTKLFAKNIFIEEIYINDNNLKVIESKLFVGLTRVTKLELQQRECIKNVVTVSRFMFTSDGSEECRDPLTMFINDFNQAQTSLEAEITRLQLEISRNGEPKLKQCEENSNKLNANLTAEMNEHNTLKGNIDELQTNNSQLIIENEILMARLTNLTVEASVVAVKQPEDWKIENIQVYAYSIIGIIVLTAALVALIILIQRRNQNDLNSFVSTNDVHVLFNNEE